MNRITKTPQKLSRRDFLIRTAIASAAGFLGLTGIAKFLQTAQAPQGSSSGRPLILVTNDDGVSAPGLIAAIQAVESLGDVIVAAPRLPQSGMGRSYPKSENNGIIEEVQLNVNDKPITAYSIYGSPAQVVSYAVLELTPRLPDICISGINSGENVGLSIISSGTIGAALEANTYDIPAIAISRQINFEENRPDNFVLSEWEASIHFTRYFAEQVLSQGLQNGVALLNINVPSDANRDTQIINTVQSRQNYFV